MNTLPCAPAGHAYVSPCVSLGAPPCVSPCVSPWSSWEDLSELDIEATFEISSRQKVARTFRRSIKDSLKDAFHLMPEKFKRAAQLNAQQLSKVERCHQSVAYKIYSYLFHDNHLLLEKGRVVAQLLERREFDSAKAVIVETIKSLKISEAFFVPVGSPDHSVVCVIKRTAESEYEVAIFNTGVGCQVLDSEEMTFAPIFSRLPLEKVCSRIVLIALIFPDEFLSRPREELIRRVEDFQGQYQDKDDSLDDDSVSVEKIVDELEPALFLQCCETLKAHFGKTQPDKKIIHFQQRFGTCSTSSLEAAMYVYGPSDTPQRLIVAARSRLREVLARIPKSPKSVAMRTDKIIALKLLRALATKREYETLEIRVQLPTS